MDQNEESLLVNPKEIKQERKQRRIENVNKSNTTSSNKKYENSAGKVVINLESDGRFDAPSTLILEDYSMKHIADLTMTDTDNVPEVLATILNELQKQEQKMDMGNLTSEELIEVLIGMKMQFQSIYHTHYWLCPCQASSEFTDQKVSESIIDLSEITYRSIHDVDKMYQENYKILLDSMTDQEFKKYLIERYKKNPLDDIDNWTRDDEIKNTIVKEPIFYKHPDTGDVYGFNIMRLHNIIDGHKLAKEKYKNKIHSIKNRPNQHGVKVAESKTKKEEEIKLIKEEETKDSATFAAALTLISLNGRQLTDNKEKIEIYTQNLRRNNLFSISDFMQDINFGVNYEIELECSHCGRSERRWLQHSLTAIEFTPLSDASKRNERKPIKSNIYFGV